MKSGLGSGWLAATPPVRVRLICGVADQGLSSAQNIALVILIAHSSTADEFGAFSVVYALMSVAIGLNQSLVSEPATLKFSNAGYSDQRAAVRATTCMSILFSGLASGVFLLIAALVEQPLRNNLLAAAAVMPGLIYFDTLKAAAIMWRRSVLLATLDAVWVAIWITGILLWSPKSAANQLLLWGLSATLVGLACFALMPRTMTKPATAFSYWRVSLLPGARSLFAEYLSVNAVGQTTTLVISGFLGFAATGGIRAAQALLGPVSTLTNAFRFAVVPEIIRAGGSRSTRGGTLLRVTVGVLLVLVAIVACVVLSLPNRIGEQILGPTWPTARDVLLPLCVARALGAFTTRAIMAMRADGKLSDLAKARLYASLAYESIIILAAIFLDIRATAWAFVVGGAAQLLILDSAERSGRRRDGIYRGAGA